MDRKHALRMLMTKHNATVKDVANILNLSPSTVYKYRANSHPDVNISDADLSWLINVLEGDR